MATLYRNLRTNRLVLLYRVSPPKMLGSWYVEEDYHTGKVVKTAARAISCLGHKIIVNPRFYAAVADLTQVPKPRLAL